MNDKLDKKTAIFDTLPTVFGYLGIGIAFGIVAKAAGFSPLYVVLMSLIIFAGSAQFITVSMLAAASPILSIILATFLVNSRMILMSMSVAPYFKENSLMENIVIGSLLTDESYALGMNKLHHTNNTLSFVWFHTANLISYATWVIASLIGALAGEFIANPEQFGLDFALVAMFIGLLYLQITSDKVLAKALQYILVAITFVLIYIGLIFIPSNLLILCVTLLSCAIGVVLKRAFF